MTRADWARLLLPKLPTLDPTWGAEVQRLWWRAFKRLRAMLAGEEGE